MIMSLERISTFKLLAIIVIVVSDSAAGGFNDYNAHVLSTGLQYRF